MQDASPLNTPEFDANLDDTTTNDGVVARIGGNERAGGVAELPLAPSIKAAIMRSLSHEQRLLLVLWYVEAMTADEIAAVLGTSETRVHQLHESIVSQLRTEATRLDRGAA